MNWLVAVKTKRRGKQGYNWYYGNRLGYLSLGAACAEASRIVNKVASADEVVLSVVINNSRAAT